MEAPEVPDVGARGLAVSSRNKNRNKRPATPSFRLAGDGGGGMDPASPPQTPTSTSPALNHKMATSGSRHLPPYQNPARPAISRRSSIQPTGNGHEFSFVRSNRFAQLSPQSSSEEEDESGDEDVAVREVSDAESSDTDLPRSSCDEEESEEEDEDEDDDDESEEEEEEDDDDQDNVDLSDDSDDEEDEDDDEPLSPTTIPSRPMAPEIPKVRVTTVTTTLVVEELSDFDPMDNDRFGVVAPTSIEYPESERSRPQSRDADVIVDEMDDDLSEESSDSDAAPRRRADFHRSMAYNNLTYRPRRPSFDPNLIPELRKPNYSGSEVSPGLSPAPDIDGNGEDDDFFEAADDAALKEFARAQRELKMRKRRSRGSSIGKRTHSERSDSPGIEDLMPLPLGEEPSVWDPMGAMARRLRRRVGDRRSLQDPPPDSIQELDEPSSGDEYAARLRMTRGFGMLFGDGETLARELPYYAMEIDEDI